MSDKYRNRPYEIQEHSAEYNDRFLIEAEKLKAVFGDTALRIEHIGSTSVPGLAGKSTIDILIIVDKASDSDRFAPQMEEMGYKSMGAFIAKDTRLFEKEENGERTFIVHVFEQSHPHTEDMIKTRDYLIAHPEEAQAYANLKRRLKEQYLDDYIAYRKEKNEYVAELTKRAIGR